MFTTGCAAVRCAVAPLHPWLQHAAPLGRREEDRALSRDVLHELDSPEGDEPDVGQRVGKPTGAADLGVFKLFPYLAQAQVFDPH